MNEHDHDRDVRHLAAEAAPKPDGPTPEEVSMLARTKDPSLTEEATDATVDAGGKTRAGVAWVRPTDLLAAKSAGWAGRGIDFHAGLAERVRSGLGRGAKNTGRGTARVGQAVSARAKQLPPLSAFGRRGGSRSMTPVTRAGISRGNR
jgi:hypothetical protein